MVRIVAQLAESITGAPGGGQESGADLEPWTVIGRAPGAEVMDEVSWADKNP